MLRVLLVEDNDLDADLVYAALEEAGDADVVLTRVLSLRAASEQLVGDSFDVVLLDLSLPDTQGLSGLHRLRAVSPSVPVVVLTGSLDDDTGMRAVARGAQDYLRKGRVSAYELLRALRYARERQQFADSTRLLAEVGATLATAADLPALRVALERTLCRGFAHSCVLDGIDDIPGAEIDVNVAVAPGSARLYASAADRPPEPADQARIAKLGLPLRAAVVVPFVVDGVERGALSLGRLEPGRPFGAADLVLAEEISRRVVGAFEHIGLQVARRDRARAEDLARLKDEFLATLSHELRTPLTTILGWTHILLEGALEPGQQAHALETIERNARNQIVLIEDVLDISHIVTGKLQLSLATMNLDDVVAAAFDAVAPLAAHKGVRLERVDHATAGLAHADRQRLQQVLANLLSNAVKFTPRGGHVTLALAREAGYLEVCVRDDGLGIAADFLPHVFERFRQADATLTRAHPGLGLGLAIARHIVELHGGTLRVESRGVGHGASFFVRVPVDGPVVTLRPVATTPLQRPAAAHDLDGHRILVVDDEADLLELLRLTLERRGAVVVEASTPQEALAALRAGSFDVLLSDIGLPGESGYDLIRHVRALPGPASLTPALALTAYASASDRRLALDAGFDHHMSKPFEPAELLAVVERLARRCVSAPATASP